MQTQQWMCIIWPAWSKSIISLFCSDDDFVGELVKPWLTYIYDWSSSWILMRLSEARGSSSSSAVLCSVLLMEAKPSAIYGLLQCLCHNWAYAEKPKLCLGLLWKTLNYSLTLTNQYCYGCCWSGSLVPSRAVNELNLFKKIKLVIWLFCDGVCMLARIEL